MLHKLTPVPRRALTIVVVCAAALVLLSLGTEAKAQTNYPLEATIVITDANGTVVTGTDPVVVSQPLTVTATGWLPENEVTLTFVCDNGSTPLGTSFAGTDGVVRKTFTVPLGASGHCTLRLTGPGTNGTTRSIEAPVLVTTPATAVAARAVPNSLSRTGINAWLWAQYAFALLSIGAALTLAARRYRTDVR